MISDGSLLRSGGETWGPVSPDNVHETGVSLHRDRQGGAVRGNAKKDLVKLAIRGFCALQAPAMLFALLYLVVRRVFGLAGGSRSDDLSKDVEILVLRHQLKVLRRQAGRPRLRRLDRVVLARRVGCSPVRFGPRSW